MVLQSIGILLSSLTLTQTRPVSQHIILLHWLTGTFHPNVVETKLTLQYNYTSSLFQLLWQKLLSVCRSIFQEILYTYQNLNDDKSSHNIFHLYNLHVLKIYRNQGSLPKKIKKCGFFRHYGGWAKTKVQKKSAHFILFDNLIPRYFINRTRCQYLLLEFSVSEDHELIPERKTVTLQIHVVVISFNNNSIVLEYLEIDKFICFN